MRKYYLEGSVTSLLSNVPATCPRRPIHIISNQAKSLQGSHSDARSKFQDFSALCIPENHDLFQYHLRFANLHMTAKNYRFFAVVN